MKKEASKPCENKVGWKKSHMYTLRYACCIITATFVFLSQLWFFSLSSNVFWLSSFPPQDLMSFLELSASSTKNCFPLIWWKRSIRRSNDMKTILRALAYLLPSSLIWGDKCSGKRYFASGASKSMHIVSSSVWRKEYYQHIVCFPNWYSILICCKAQWRIKSCLIRAIRSLVSVGRCQIASAQI